MIYLMNSAVMPAGCYGTYRYSPAFLVDLKCLVAAGLGEYTSCLGYPQNAELVEAWVGIRPEVSRANVEFKDGDRAFVMRLKSRVANPTTKGGPVSEDPADWEFAWVEFSGAQTHERS